MNVEREDRLGVDCNKQLIIRVEKDEEVQRIDSRARLVGMKGEEGLNFEDKRV